MTTPLPSLRERSKAKRRKAIQRAALQLFAERGYDGATIAEIADVAEVAPRTVSMYFPTKLDIAMSLSGDIAERLTATFRRHPELPFTEVVDRWLAGEAEGMDPDLAVLTTAMFDANPGLRAVSTTQVSDAAQVGWSALTAQIGRAPDDPMIPIVGAAVGGALAQYLATVMKSGPTPGLHDPFMRYLRVIISAATSS